MAYPSIFSALATPQPTDRLNSPSHSTLHQNENSAILEIERAVGLDSSIIGTVIGDLRNPASNGGGHVQTANKGGTGQTSYNKGDLLVAQSSSVLSKLAVGNDGQALVASSGQPTGVTWQNVVSNKVAVVASFQGISGANTPTVLFSATVTGSTLGVANAIKYTGLIQNLSLFTGRGVQLDVAYGGSSLLSVTGTVVNSVVGLKGQFEGTIISNGSVAQIGAATLALASGANADNLSQKFLATSYGTTSVVSSADQSLTITAILTGGNTFGSIFGTAFVVEKIA